MKKFLLSCFLALGIGANAQYNYTLGFEEESSGHFSHFGGGTVSTASAAICTGSAGGQIAISASVTRSGFMILLDEIGQSGNGQKVDVTGKYKKAANLTGTISLAYFILDEASNLWTVVPFGTTNTLSAPAITTCASLSATIPAGALQPNKTYGIGMWFERTGTTTGNIYMDDIVINQEVVGTVPTCTTFTNPTSGATVSAGNVAFTWNSVPTAVNYKLTVGTTPGGSEILDTVVAGTSINVSLVPSTTYYTKVVPSNLNGDAVGCTEITFSTDDQINYCGPLTSTAPTQIAPIKSVSFAGLTNASDPSATTIGTFPVHQDFTTIEFPVEAGQSLPITILGTTNGNPANGWAATVFIDWNNDGDFDDANEQYFNTFATKLFIGGVADNPVSLTKDIAIPADAALGKRRMRVKYNFQSTAATTMHEALATACSNMINGQVEDYTIEVKLPTNPPGCTTITAPTNGATNFPANGTITWESATGATGYKVYIGTSAGATDVVNGTEVTETSYNASLTPFITYYAKVVPFNIIGDATGCTEISFTTGDVVYCTAAATSTSASFEKISRVQFAGIDQSSTSPAGYEDYTAVKGIVNQNTSTNPITVTISNYASQDQIAVWIDFNQDGVFADDATEKTILTSAASATGNIVVPADAKLGNTRMRVRVNYNAAPPACGTTSFGQVEDYTIEVKENLAVSDVTKANISVYPNPFTDVLRISDVKDVKSISVSDMSGRQVKTLKPSAELNLSSLRTGVYVVTLHMNDGSVKTIKAIKK